MHVTIHFKVFQIVLEQVSSWSSSKWTNIGSIVMPQTNEQKYVYEPECELFHVHVSCEDSSAEPSITVIIDDSESPTTTTGVQLDMSWWVIIRPFIYPCATKRYHMWQYMAQQRLNVISNISVLSVMQFNAKSVFSPLLYRCLHRITDYTNESEDENEQNMLEWNPGRLADGLRIFQDLCVRSLAWQTLPIMLGCL